MKILIACEESQTVCIEFRKRGHEAYSCDILPCSGEHPEWHCMNISSSNLHRHYCWLCNNTTEGSSTKEHDILVWNNLINRREN